MKIEIIQGNIVNQADLEALVNSANANLRLGSGVAGAIHTAAGPKLEEYCKPFAPLAYGAYLVTPGFKLPNPWVIHVRAASYTNHDDAPALLQSAVVAALKGAHDNVIHSMAIPAIGTGVFAFPPMLAAQIMAESLIKADALSPNIELLRVCVATENLRDVYTSAFQQTGLQVQAMA
jgi:O-acetyl-ADP-ribose deacetylase (regulator of RNase III)